MTRRETTLLLVLIIAIFWVTASTMDTNDQQAIIEVTDEAINKAKNLRFYK